MNSRICISILLAFSLSTPGLALADRDKDKSRHSQGRSESNRHGNDDSNRRDMQWRPSDRRSHDARPQEFRDHRDNRGRPDFADRDHQRGAGPRHEIHRGQRLPVEYRYHYYVVDDWHSHRLTRPPRGHHWVQTGGDYVLVAIASGIVLQLFLQ